MTATTDQRAVERARAGLLFLHGTTAQLSPGDQLLPGAQTGRQVHFRGHHVDAIDPVRWNHAHATQARGPDPSSPVLMRDLALEWAGMAVDVWCDEDHPELDETYNHHDLALDHPHRPLPCLRVYTVTPDDPAAVEPDGSGSASGGRVMVTLSGAGAVAVTRPVSAGAGSGPGPVLSDARAPIVAPVSAIATAAATAGRRDVRPVRSPEEPLRSGSFIAGLPRCGKGAAVAVTGPGLSPEPAVAHYTPALAACPHLRFLPADPVTGLPDLTPSGQEFEAASSTSLSAVVHLSGGVNYFVRWAQTRDSTAYNPVFTWTLSAAPEHNAVAHAAQIPVPAVGQTLSFEADLRWATTEPGEAGSGYRTLWWKVSPDQDTTFAFASAQGYKRLRVVEADPVTGLPDLADTGREATGATSSAPVSATFTLTGGKTYFIRWANRNDSSSDTYAPVFTWTLTRTS